MQMKSHSGPSTDEVRVKVVEKEDINGKEWHSHQFTMWMIRSGSRMGTAYLTRMQVLWSATTLQTHTFVTTRKCLLLSRRRRRAW